jgi:hypothetical protein
MEAINQLERAILQAIEELGDDAYSIPIRRKVHELLNKPWWERTSTSPKRRKKVISVQRVQSSETNSINPIRSGAWILSATP